MPAAESDLPQLDSGPRLGRAAAPPLRFVHCDGAVRRDRGYRVCLESASDLLARAF